MIIQNASVFTEENCFTQKEIHIQNDRIVSETTETETVLDATDCYAIPGLTDLHFHGCVGADFCDGTIQSIQKIAAYEAQNGITSIAPATMTLDDDTLTTIFSTASKAKPLLHQQTDHIYADLVGIHMEGPYLSSEKKGAQNSTFLKKPDVAHFRKMNALSCGLIKIVSIAPEAPDALDFISAVKEEVVLSIAHTTANYEIASAALDHGASHITHLYNAMSAFSHRSPGVVGAAFDHKNCHVELICDGVHIDPCMIRATFQLFGADRIILISDSMMATGMKDGNYTLGGQAVQVKGTLATLSNGTIAGSATNLMECMKKAVSFGIPLEQAVQCATINPAKELGIDHEYGSISIGKYANIVLLDQQLRIKHVICRGKLSSCSSLDGK